MTDQGEWLGSVVPDLAALLLEPIHVRLITFCRREYVERIRRIPGGWVCGIHCPDWTARRHVERYGWDATAGFGRTRKDAREAARAAWSNGTQWAGTPSRWLVQAFREDEADPVRFHRAMSIGRSVEAWPAVWAALEVPP